LADVVAHKYLFYNELAIFRVSETTTLKIAYYLIANDLRATPNERKKIEHTVTRIAE